MKKGTTNWQIVLLLYVIQMTRTYELAKKKKEAILSLEFGENIVVLREGRGGGHTELW